MKHIIKIAVLILFISSVANTALSIGVGKSSSTPTNMAIIDSLLRSAFSDAVASAGTFAPKALYVRVESLGADSYVLAKFTSAAAGHFAIVQSAEKSDSRIELNAKNIRVTYTADSSDNDSLVRVVTVGLSGLLTDNQGILHTIATGDRTRTDKIARDEVPAVETDDYRFCRGQVPPRPLTFFEEVAAPAIAVGATLVSLVLLFTVRSR